MKLNIRSKVILYTVGLITILISMMVAFMAVREHKNLYKIFAEQNLTAADAFSRAVTINLETKKMKGLTQSIRAFIGTHSVKEAYIADSKAIILIDGAKKNKKTGKLLTSPFVPNIPEYDSWHIEDGPNLMTIIGTVYGDTGKAGYILLSFPDTPIKKQLKAFYIQMLYVFLVCLLLGAALAFFFSGRLVKPLRILTERAKGIREGQEIPIEDIIRQDEIGIISRGFAILVRDLRNSNQELQALADSLEKKVQERTKELEKATVHAQQAARSKSEFLATMSHEIRTPLNGIIGFSTITLEGNLDPKQKENIGIIHTSATSLLSIINDILDFSKLEAGKLEIEHIPFDFHEMIDHTSVLFQRDFKDKGVEFTVKDLKAIPQKLIGDPARLRQVLLNLFSNALKFTHKGYVSLEVLAVKDTDKSMVLEFSVQDTGIGMPPHIQDKLFGKFTQADSSISRKYGGTGLGLAISKKICLLMGGDIHVSSEEGKGTRFWFNVPFEKVTEQTDLAKTEAKSKKLASKNKNRTGKLKILVAEDNKVNQMLMTALLKKAGHAFDLAENGKLAVDAAQEKQYDLILMDIQMPEMDGLEATQRIRNLSKYYETVPIAALTAHAMQGDKEKFLEAGMDHVLLKPLNVDQLYDLIDKYN